MRDLDMSDVLADAQRMQDVYYDQLLHDLDTLEDAELDQTLYQHGIQARAGREFSMDVVQIIGYIRLTRINTTLCEGCLDRYGCDVCCPPTYMDWVGDAMNRDAEEEMLGRPLFPNEY